MLEARLKNRQPIAVTSHANSVEKALNDALDKVIASMETIYGRSKDHPQLLMGKGYESKTSQTVMV